MTYQENYQKWLNFAELPAYLRDELVAMDEKTKEDAFYTNLEFGTAGMRGLIGAGTNRINIYVVRQATEGLAQLIDSKGEEAKKCGVAIAYDSRHFSPEFAFESAQVLAAHGIKSYVFESLRPTPELSFAVRHLHTFAGIMVTASHNPAPFNGYKVYGEDGGQMPPADADALTDYIRAIENPFTVQLADLEESKANGLIEVIGENVDAEYLKEVKGVNINQHLINEYGRDMKIVQVKCWLVVLLHKLDLKQFKLLKLKQFLMQTSQLLNLQTQKAKQPLLLLKNLAAKWMLTSWLQLTQMLTVLVLKSANQTVLTSTFLVTKSERLLLNIFLKLTKQLVRFLKMLPSVNQSYPLSW